MPNNIDWAYIGNEPHLVDVVIVKSDSTVLNGAVVIARYGSVHPKVSCTIHRECAVADNNTSFPQQSFTVANVTLRAGSNYQIEFVDTNNSSHIYATSQHFSIIIAHVSKYSSE